MQENNHARFVGDPIPLITGFSAISVRAPVAFLLAILIAGLPNVTRRI